MGKSGPFQGSLVYNDFDVSAACAAGFQGEAKVGCCQRPGVGRHTSIPSARMTGSVCMYIYIYNMMIYNNWIICMSYNWYMGLSENSVPLHPMASLIIIPTKWL